MSTAEQELQQQNEETAEKLRLKMEELVHRYFQNREIAAERREENQRVVEELEELFLDNGMEEFTIPLPSGEQAVLSPRFREREVLDKDLLAEEMQIPKDELKTPFDFCMFTSQGKLTPDMITKHTTIERDVKLKISKRKATSKRRRGKSSESTVES